MLSRAADPGRERSAPRFAPYPVHTAGHSSAPLLNVVTPQARSELYSSRQMEPHPQRARGSASRLQYTRGPPADAAPAPVGRSLPHMSVLLQDPVVGRPMQMTAVERRAQQSQQQPLPLAYRSGSPQESARTDWARVEPGTSAHYDLMSPVSTSSQMDVEDDYMQQQQQQQQQRSAAMARRQQQDYATSAGYTSTSSCSSSNASAVAAAYETVRSLQSTPRYNPSQGPIVSSSSSPQPPTKSDDDTTSSSSYSQQQRPSSNGGSYTSPLVVDDEEMPLQDDSKPTGVSGSPTAPPEKSSRYLREIDRRAILSRIASGEKQSALAKEYQVSRAAICNLNKHREEVFARKDGNPLAKHPKKPRIKTPGQTGNKSASKPSSKKWTSSSSVKYALGSASGSNRSSKADLHEIKSRAAALLLTTLRKKHTAQNEFRRTSERLMRLLMEEALALVPIKTVEIFLNDQSKDSGVALEHPPCAVSMEQDGCPMLELFHLMEPDQPTGYICFDSGSSTQTDAEISEASEMDVAGLSLFDAHLPSTLSYHNIFLLDHVAMSGARLSAAVRCLQERGAVKSMIYIVSLMTTAETVAQIRTQHPGVKIVTAQIEEEESVGNDDDSVGATSSSSGSQVSMMRQRLEQVYHTTSC